jgi:hypothetical protein
VLLFAPNGYSWYFTWIVPLLCFFPSPAWLLLTILEFLSYKIFIDYRALSVWHFDPLFQWLCYAPFYALLGWEFLWNPRGPQPSNIDSVIDDPVVDRPLTGQQAAMTTKPSA